MKAASYSANAGSVFALFLCRLQLCVSTSLAAVVTVEHRGIVIHPHVFVLDKDNELVRKMRKFRS